MKKIISLIICVSVFICSLNIVNAEENPLFKNIVSDSVKNVMQNTVMILPGAQNAFVYGKNYSLKEFGEAVKNGDGISVSSDFLREAFPEASIAGEVCELNGFAEENNLAVTEKNGIYYISGKDYELPSEISRSINSFFGVYVKNGSKGSGSFENPAGSIQTAKNVIQEVKKSIGLPDGGITVYFREGNYTVTNTILFNESDSGMEGSPITYTRYKNENVVIEGGVSVLGSEFTDVTDSNMKKKLPDVDKVVCVDLTSKLEGFNDIFKTADPLTWSLYYNNSALILARWPNDQMAYTGEVLRPGKNRGESFEFVVGDTRIKNWLLEDDPRMIGWFAYTWANEKRKIIEIDTTTLSISSDDYAERGISSNKEYYVYNMATELDAPGEYYFDTKTNYLYLYPVEGDANDAEFLKNKVQFSLLSDDMLKFDRAEYINIERLNFENSLGYCINVLDTCKNIEIKGCGFTNISYGISLAGFNHRIQSCDFYNVMTQCITSSCGDRQKLIPSGTVITNNKMQNISVTSRNTAPIAFSGCGDVISHNELSGSPHTGMSYGGNDNIVEYNEFYNCLSDEVHDAGVIYGGRNVSVLGNVIRNNYFHDNYPSICNVYFDDGNSDVIVESNVFENSGTAVFIHGGVANQITDNLCIDMNYCVNSSGYANSWDIDIATQTVNSFTYHLKAFDYKSEPWTKYNHVFKYLYNDENPFPMYDNVVTGNICVNEETETIPANFPDDTVPYVTVENNTVITGEEAKSYDIPEKYQDVMDNSGIYIDDYRTEMTGLNNFDLLWPLDKAERVEASEVSFKWTQAENAYGYQFTLATDSEFEDVISNKIVTTNNVTLSKLNYFNTRYYWKVKAIPNDVNSIESDELLPANQEYFTFTTKAYEAVSKERLYDQIEICEGRINGVVEGDNPGDYKIGTLDQMKKLINDYKELVEKETITQKEVNQYTETLKTEFDILNNRKNPAIFDLASIINNGGSWAFTPNQTVFSPEKITFTNLGTQTLGTNNRLGTHEIFKANIRLEGLSENWFGIALRAQASPTAVAWGGNEQYLFVMKEATFELQRLGGENSFLFEYPNNIVKDGDWNEYEMSVLDTEEGSVEIVVKINGEVVVEYEDTNAPITGMGYLELYNCGRDNVLEIMPVEE